MNIDRNSLNQYMKTISDVMIMCCHAVAKRALEWKKHTPENGPEYFEFRPYAYTSFGYPYNELSIRLWKDSGRLKMKLTGPWTQSRELYHTKNAVTQSLRHFKSLQILNGHEKNFIDQIEEVKRKTAPKKIVEPTIREMKKQSDNKKANEQAEAERARSAKNEASKEKEKQNKPVLEKEEDLSEINLNKMKTRELQALARKIGAKTATKKTDLISNIERITKPRPKQKPKKSRRQRRRSNNTDSLKGKKMNTDIDANSLLPPKTDE